MKLELWNQLQGSFLTLVLLCACLSLGVEGKRGLGLLALAVSATGVCMTLLVLYRIWFPVT